MSSIIKTFPPKAIRGVSRNRSFDFPELWSRVYIVGEEQALFPRMLALARCGKAESVADADIVLFTGGSDVSPCLYGKNSHKTTYAYSDNDLRDILVFREAVSLGVPMVGVCRGAQFLHVANGGKLYQDVDNHNKPHMIWCKKEMRSIRSSSVHHQMCEYQPSMTVIADAIESTYRWSDDKICYRPPKKPMSPKDFDIEAFWYPETACLGVQGHPEYPGYEEYTKWFLDQINSYIVYNPDLTYRGEKREARQRLSQEIIDRRKWREPSSFELFVKEYG